MVDVYLIPRVLIKKLKSNLCLEDPCCLDRKALPPAEAGSLLRIRVTTSGEELHLVGISARCLEGDF